MLHDQIRTSLTVLAVTALLGCFAQVTYDKPIQITGNDAQRTVQGVGEPESNSSAITVNGVVVSGGYTWCSATMSSDTILLVALPDVASLSDGLLLRFLSPVDQFGPTYVKGANGLASVPLVRPDGLPPTNGQLLAGAVCEVLYANGYFILMDRTETGCPPGFLQATDRLCIEADVVTGMLFHPSRDRCANLGGKLCSWAGYVVGCTVLAGQLQGLFSEWEWMDDTSNHAHGSDQVGRLTCGSQRNTGLLSTLTANNRCCYHPR